MFHQKKRSLDILHRLKPKPKLKQVVYQPQTQQ